MLKEYEAEKLGFEFTGMTADFQDKEKIKYNKNRADTIKKTVKGADYKVVNHNCTDRFDNISHWRRIYGNEIFLKNM